MLHQVHAALEMLHQLDQLPSAMASPTSGTIVRRMLCMLPRLRVPDAGRALWQACQQEAERAQHGLQLVREAVPSLSALQAESGPWDGILAAGGAAVGALPEIGVLAGAVIIRCNDNAHVQLKMSQ